MRSTATKIHVRAHNWTSIIAPEESEYYAGTDEAVPNVAEPISSRKKGF